MSKPTPTGPLAQPSAEKIDEKKSITISDREIFPVETSTFLTVDFSKNPSAILYSRRLTACPFLIIKNFNPETKKYDNVVTAMHFFPNNAWDEKATAHNFSLALEDFEKKRWSS